MDDCKYVPTSAEVWAVIHARHRDLKVFSSFSNPEGTAMGRDGSTGEMETWYGFNNADFPLMRAKTTWRILPEGGRADEIHQYWLCLPINPDA